MLTESAAGSGEEPTVSLNMLAESTANEGKAPIVIYLHRY